MGTKPKPKGFYRNKNNTNNKTISSKLFFGLSVLVLGSMLSLSSNVLLSSSPASATSRQSSITITTSTNTPSLDLGASEHGIFKKSGTSTINVSTDNYSGYTLSLINPSTGTNATSLISTSNSSNTIPSISSALSESSFTSSSDYINKWGYRPSQYVTTDGSNQHTIVTNNTNFLPIPTSEGDILDITTTANGTGNSGGTGGTGNSGSNTYTIDFGTKIDFNTLPGTYTKSLVLTAVGNPIIYSISFTDNTGDASVSGLPSSTGTLSTSDLEILIPQDVPLRTGYNFVGWCESAPSNNGTSCSSNTPYPASTTATPSYYQINQTVDNSSITLYPTWETQTYTITLNTNGGTGDSSSTSVSYGATTLETITNPTRANTTATRTVGNFTKGSSASSATVSSTSTLNSTATTTYSFNGWYKESAATNKIASNATTPVLSASTSYTDANGKWTSTSGQTLFAGWDSSTGSYSSVTLPTITLTGHTCHWNTDSSDTGTSYNSGASIVPSGNLSLTGFCVADTYTVSLNNSGGTGGSSSATATYNATTLTAITNPTKGSVAGTRTISGLAANGTNASGATVTFQSSGNCTSTSNCKSTNTTTYAFNGWHEGSSTGAVVTNGGNPANLQPNTTYTDASSQWTYTSGVTLHAGYTPTVGSYSSVTLPTITKTGHTCGWDTNQAATNPTYSSGASMTPGNNITLYGICKANTYNTNLNPNGGTSGSETTNVTYGATTLGTITNPTKANTTGTRTISGLTADGTNASGATVTFQTSGNCTGTSNCKSTNTTTYAFNGWYKESAATNKIASNDTTPVLQASTSYTDANGKWTSTSGQTLFAGWTASAGAYASVTLPTITKTGYTCGWDTNQAATNPTYSSGSSMTPGGNITLYGICKANTYTVSLNSNSGTGGSNSATATYNATTLTAITNPTRPSTTSTRTVSDFTKSTSASSASVSSTTTLNSTATTTYTFNGWHAGSATGTLVTNGGNPANLQPSTAYTDTASKWTYTSGVTLHAGWNTSTSSYSNVTLPTITLTGHTCHWNTNSSDTGTSYNSGASITPNGNLSLTGFCSANNYNITFTFDSNISNIVVKNSAGTSTVATVSTSGGTASLTYNTTYKVVPTYASGYELNSMTKSSGSGTLSGDSFTVEAGTATIATTSKSSAPGDCTDTSTCMQTMTISNCPTTATTVTDARDGNTYKVQKLDDNNCWMLDNLALDPTALTQAELYGSSAQPLTNASNTTLGYLKNGGGTTNDKYPTAKLNNVAWTSSAQNYYSIPMVVTTYINTVPSSPPTDGAGSNKIGVYYNYCAASAGSYCYGNNNTPGMSSGNATEDLCPSGWRLPTGGDDGEFKALRTFYNKTPKIRTALSLPYSGYFYDGAPSQQDIGGYWWSSTRANSEYYMYLLIVDTSTTPSAALFRYQGQSIRCVKSS